MAQDNVHGSDGPLSNVISLDINGDQHAGTASANGKSHSEADGTVQHIEAPTDPGDNEASTNPASNEASTHAGHDEGDGDEGNDQPSLHTKKKKKRKPKSQRGLVGHPEIRPSTPSDDSRALMS